MEGRSKRKPRVRKTVPTVRERTEAAKEQSQKAKPRRVRKVLQKTVSPVKTASSKLKLPDNRFTRPVKTLGRFLKKALGWLVPKYFINAWRELKLVTWPSRYETWRLTLAVFVFALVFGSIVAGVDKVLETLFRKFILK